MAAKGDLVELKQQEWGCNSEKKDFPISLFVELDLLQKLILLKLHKIS
jgi:hypothetical protein